MIINEIDENNSENNRTIDTETGVYLKADGCDPRDQMYSFILVDGETLIGISTLRNRELDEKKISSVKYFVDGFVFKGEAKNRNYASIIKKLLEECGDSFKYNVRRWGYKEYVEVRFEPKALEKLKAWEKGNV